MALRFYTLNLQNRVQLFKGLKGNPLEGYLTSGKNNVIEEYGVIYSNQKEITFTFTIEYNGLNIPIKVSETNSQDIFNSKEFEYSLKCE